MTQSRAPSNSSLALEKLRAMVFEHRDEPQFRLPPERELASVLSVGRRAVRRALEVLEAEGAIRRRQGKGTFAGHGLDDADGRLAALGEGMSPADVMETRLLIEPSLARLAAVRASREDIEALERLVRKTAGAQDDDAWELWDSAFHRRIAECAGNRMLLSVFDAVQGIRKDPHWRNLRSSVRNTDRRSINAREHQAIVTAIAERDAPGAHRAMSRHLATVDEMLRGHLLGLTDDTPSTTEHAATLTDGASHDAR